MARMKSKLWAQCGNCTRYVRKTDKAVKSVAFTSASFRCMFVCEGFVRDS